MPIGSQNVKCLRGLDIIWPLFLAQQATAWMGFGRGRDRFFLCFKITFGGNNMETERAFNRQLELPTYAITVA